MSESNQVDIAFQSCEHGGELLLMFAREIGGSIIHFYMKWYNIEYADAVTKLTKMLL